MALDASPKPCAPQPGVLKAIGILNIFFGGMLLLCGLGCLNWTAPVVVANKPLQIEPVTTQAFFDEMRRQRIDDLRAREEAAGREDERDRIKKERAEVEAKHPRVEEEIDFPRVNADLVWLSRYLWYDLVSGPVLNLLLVVAGVGLVLRKNWARWLALATAALKIVRLVALGAFLATVVIPRVGGSLDALLATEMGRSVITQAIEQQARQGGGPPGPQPGPREVVRLFRGLGTVSVFAFLCLSSIYPLVVLILLSRPGARAACRASEVD
jgi:hypothetical protein